MLFNDFGQSRVRVRSRAAGLVRVGTSWPARRSITQVLSQTCRITQDAGCYLMIENTLGEIENRIHQAIAVNPEQKRELLDLLTTLKAEINTLAQTNGEQAHSITGFAKVSTYEATRAKQNQQLRELSVRGLRSSVDGFEQSHPKLVQIVNSISNLLANLGI